jgi:choline dehydrogenase-like flavoprotein
MRAQPSPSSETLRDVVPNVLTRTEPAVSVDSHVSGKRIPHRLSEPGFVYAAVVPHSSPVVVVGSGPPGAAAALFLSRAGAEVLLLEAGAKRSSLGLTVRAGGFTLFKIRRELKQRQGVALTGDPRTELYEDIAPGGLTNHWSCAVPRFSPDDFADAQRAGEPYTWPISYADIEAWYGRVEPLLHISGAVTASVQLPAGNVRHPRKLGAAWGPIADQALKKGRTLVAMPYAYGADTTITLSGTVFNSFVRLIGPEVRAGRLMLRCGARVMRLEWSPQSKRVEAVIVRDADTGSESRIPCRAVVLAAGAIATAEILLASSSSEFPEGLGNTHGVLGRYLHDHPLGKVVVDIESSLPVHPTSYLTRPTLDRSPPLYAAACMQWGGVETLTRSLFKGEPGRLRELGFSVFGTMAPSPDNWVGLDRAQSSQGKSGLQLHVKYPPEAEKALEQARDDLANVLEGAGLKPRVRMWHVEPVGNSKHYGGTCRMHASPRFGMIDAWNRLHAVRNVAVVDSAAFTTGPEKNPVLTAMTLAARAGNRLAEELRAGDL